MPESRGTFGYLFALPGLALLVYLVVHTVPKCLWKAEFCR